MDFFSAEKIDKVIRMVVAQQAPEKFKKLFIYYNIYLWVLLTLNVQALILLVFSLRTDGSLKEHMYCMPIRECAPVSVVT